MIWVPPSTCRPAIPFHTRTAKGISHTIMYDLYHTGRLGSFVHNDLHSPLNPTDIIPPLYRTHLGLLENVAMIRWNGGCSLQAALRHSAMELRHILSRFRLMAPDRFVASCRISEGDAKGKVADLLIIRQPQRASVPFLMMDGWMDDRLGFRVRGGVEHEEAAGDWEKYRPRAYGRLPSR